MSNFAQYIGTPWQAGAQGPEAFDCMAFFRHIQRRHFGVAVPQVIAPDYDDATALADLMSTHPERQRWLRIEKPAHGCAAIVHRPMHIGVWLDVDGGGVLHCVRGAGVVFTSDSAWPVSGFGRRELFRHAP
jgi:hypothetical protein